MLVAAAICPEAPFLLAGLSGMSGTVDPDPELRAACAEAVSWLVGVKAGRLVVVGGGATTTAYPLDAPFTIGPFTGRGNPYGPACLPPSLGLGRQLVRAAGGEPSAYRSVAYDAPPAAAVDLGRELVEDPATTALLVLADGTATRGPKAPGYADSRAAAYDEALRAAVVTADPAALRDLDPALGAELMCRGRAAFQVLAGALAAPDASPAEQLSGASPATKTLYEGDPFGVYYLVAQVR